MYRPDHPELDWTYFDPVANHQLAGDDESEPATYGFAFIALTVAFLAALLVMVALRGGLSP